MTSVEPGRQSTDDVDPDRDEEVLVDVTVPCEAFALADAVDRVDEATFCSGAVTGAGGGVMPLLWARAPDEDRLEAALREDSTTSTVARLVDRGDERLYRTSWADSVKAVAELLTGADGTMLDASADRDGWRIGLLYPSRSELVEVTAACEADGVPVDVRTIRRMDGDSGCQYGLTTTQYRALTLACERGYFDVPRGANLDDIAGTLDISHQALSERLRRGTQRLISQALLRSRSERMDRF